MQKWFLPLVAAILIVFGSGKIAQAKPGDVDCPQVHAIRARETADKRALVDRYANHEIEMSVYMSKFAEIGATADAECAQYGNVQPAPVVATTQSARPLVVVQRVYVNQVVQDRANTYVPAPQTMYVQPYRRPVVYRRPVAFAPPINRDPYAYQRRYPVRQPVVVADYHNRNFDIAVAVPAGRAQVVDPYYSQPVYYDQPVFQNGDSAPPGYHRVMNMGTREWRWVPDGGTNRRIRNTNQYYYDDWPHR